MKDKDQQSEEFERKVAAIFDKEITRTIAIEHKGEKISLEVHIHLTQEEIDRIITPAVLKSLACQSRQGTGQKVGMK